MLGGGIVNSNHNHNHNHINNGFNFLPLNNAFPHAKTII
jgi:hypothetical protein